MGHFKCWITVELHYDKKEHYITRILFYSRSDRSFLMGSTKRIWVDVEVANNGEDSYETMLYMTVPQSLSYVNFDRLDTSKDVPILCSAPTPSTNNTLRCDIGNPLPFHSKARLRVFFQPRYGSDFKSSYDFLIVANSTNPEDVHKRGDNLIPVSFPIRVQTDMKVFGVSDPQPVRHNASLYKKFEEKNSETEIGPEVTHVYEVKCEGPSDIEQAEVRILWPSYTLSGQHFVYLLEQPLVEGPAVCEHVDDVNPLALTLQRKGKWLARRTQQEQDYFQIHRETLSTVGSGGAGGGGGFDYETEEEILRRGQSGFFGGSRGSSSSSSRTSTTFRNTGFGTSSSSTHGISGENYAGAGSASGSNERSSTYSRHGDNVHDYSRQQQGGGGLYTGSSGYYGGGSGYYSGGGGGSYVGGTSGSDTGGSGYHHQNTSALHEYRREHSLGGGSSGGYTRTYNYSRSYSSQSEYGKSSSSSGGTGDEYQVGFSTFWIRKDRSHHIILLIAYNPFPSPHFLLLSVSFYGNVSHFMGCCYTQTFMLVATVQLHFSSLLSPIKLSF